MIHIQRSLRDCIDGRLRRVSRPRSLHAGGAADERGTWYDATAR